jgi:hypothetical protein
MKKNWISWLALTLSIAACFITWLRVDVYINNDTFVGFMAGVMGACATILVGTQIYSSIDTRSSINKLNESFNNKIKEQETSYDSRMRDIKVLNNKLTYELKLIKKELAQAKEERALSEERINISIAKASAIAFSSIQPFSSFANFHQCLISSLKIEDHESIKNTLQNMKVLIKITESKLKKGEPIANSHIEMCKKLDYNSLKEYPLSILIESKYNECHNKLLELINKIQAKK